MTGTQPRSLYTKEMTSIDRAMPIFQLFGVYCILSQSVLKRTTLLCWGCSHSRSLLHWTWRSWVLRQWQRSSKKDACTQTKTYIYMYMYVYTYIHTCVCIYMYILDSFWYAVQHTPLTRRESWQSVHRHVKVGYQTRVTRAERPIMPNSVGLIGAEPPNPKHPVGTILGPLGH